MNIAEREDYEQYLSLGSVDYLRSLKLRDTPLVPISIQGIPKWGYCPSCSRTISPTSDPKCCRNCLQRILW